MDPQSFTPRTGGGAIRAFNVDWFIFPEYIGIKLVLFIGSKEPINHANESKRMSANTLVFIRTWSRGAGAAVDVGVISQQRPSVSFRRSNHLLAQTGISR